MPPGRSLSRFAMRSTFAVALLAAGCALGSSPSPRVLGPPQHTYGAWEFDTLGELDQLLDIKGCEGWRLAEAFTRDDKIIAIIVYDGAEPPPANAACRPSP